LFYVEKTPLVLNNTKEKDARKVTCTEHAAHCVDLKYITYCSFFCNKCF